MSITLPEVTVVGTLTRDPEVRFTGGGKAVVNVSVATNTRKKDPGGNWVDGDTTFLNGTIWDVFAENVAESLSRGDRVIGHGQIKQRSFETREGEKRSVLEVEFDSFGPDLRFATAAPQKGGAQRQKPTEDAWGGDSNNDEPDW
ncbi:single-stranded DNA-binding protein [Mycobacteroides abscessus]|uniref:single-stranded DNA-binding protein n=1 Tax=Mycobacteroides abscessus TaxID=36809 RepID=UPI0005DC0DBF|nr:single-stranded DNA-binding protein [Mycobacteroides abscessus]WJJ55486.1 ssDNA binding protein [Mycobacterium phage prophiT49-2]MDB2213892.1 single-stranded DNA-binding protein [Mycobacteroides abscessus subsp. massiliense]CPS10064.1 single-stranded DNA-binding protein [Mycobacteroides abscessus]CPT90612.1 single-stranded DNA-binding protein [Mycobacteroides abscessus]CPU99241.1 single-stranded DNA-binding protein [Mycobacteroides abscessus]